MFSSFVIKSSKIFFHLIKNRRKKSLRIAYKESYLLPEHTFDGASSSKYKQKFCGNCDLFECLSVIFFFRVSRIDDWRTKQQKKSGEEMMMWNTAMNNSNDFWNGFLCCVFKLSINKLFFFLPVLPFFLFGNTWLSSDNRWQFAVDYWNMNRLEFWLALKDRNSEGIRRLLITD